MQPRWVEAWLRGVSNQSEGRIEFYERRPGPSGVDWIGLELLGEMPAAGEPSFVGELVVDTPDPGDGFEVVAFDREGNVARTLR